MQHSLEKVAGAILAAFFIMATASGYWAVIQQDWLTSRPDNPRLLLDEQRINRGSIVDREGRILAENVLSETSLQTRHYPYPSAAPATGYYSIRYGVAGVEARFDSLLRGDLYLSQTQQFINEVLNRPQIGGDVQLAIDITLQEAVDQTLSGYHGGAVVLNAETGEILAITSQPTFDPEQLDEQWEALIQNPEAPLLNRSTQGQYQPGAAMSIIVMAAAFNYNLSIDNLTWPQEGGVTINDATLPCATPTDEVRSIEDAFAKGCPGPFGQLGHMLGTERLRTIISDFGLLTSPDIISPQDSPNENAQNTMDDLYLLSYGQSQLTVTPLDMARVAAAIANGGNLPAVYLAIGQRLPGETSWEPVDPIGTQRGAIGSAALTELRMLMSNDTYSDLYSHSSFALAGPDGTLNAWFVGFWDNGSVETQPIAVAVLLEDVHSSAPSTDIGLQILSTAALMQ